MFDLTSSKLLLVGLVALLVVGPKDLPILLRTIGRYIGMIKKQATEFRQQFDEAMRESELSELRKDVENLGRDTEEQLREATRAAEEEMEKASRSAEADADPAASTAKASEASTLDGPKLDGDGFPIFDSPPPVVGNEATTSGPAAAAAAVAADTSAVPASPEASPVTTKSGA